MFQTLSFNVSSDLVAMLFAQQAAPGATQWWGGEDLSGGGDSIFMLTSAIMVLLLLAVLVLFSILRQRGNHEQRVRADYGQIKHLLGQNRRKVELLENHALDYLPAMSQESTRAFTLAKRMLMAIQQVIDEVEPLLAQADYASLIEAESILARRLYLRKSSVHMIEDGIEVPELPRSKWGSTLDDLFQVVGEEISRASNRAREFNSVKRRSRRTYQDLREAGIRFLAEQGRRLTASFQSPFRIDDEDDNEHHPSA